MVLAITIIFVGDINLGRTAGRMIIQNPRFNPFSKTKHILQNADLTCGNLESPIADLGFTQRGMFRFVAPPKAAVLLKQAGFDYLACANNHAWDFGKKALFETRRWLLKNKIGCSGTGNAPYEPWLTTAGATKIAIFSVTAVSNWGFKKEESKYVAKAGPLILEKIRKYKKIVDLVIVSYHGDAEYRFSPSKNKRSFAQKCIEAGADIFWGHHPHYIQPVVFKNGKLIAYSLGNFVFKQKDPYAKIGLILKVKWEQKVTQFEEIYIKADYIPLLLQ